MTTPLLTEKELSQIADAVNDAQEHNSVVGLMELGQCVPRLLADVRTLHAERDALRARVAALEDCERIAWALTAAQRMAHWRQISSGAADCLGVLLPTGDMVGLPLDSSLPLTPDARAAIAAARATTDAEEETP